MHKVDYELGLASGDYSNAGGSAQLVACNTKCIAIHPFNKSKREACKAGCSAQFEIRQGGVDPTPAVVEASFGQQNGGQGMGVGVTIETSQKPSPQPPAVVVEEKKGLGTGAIIGISIGAAALIGTLAYFALRKK